MLGFLHIVRPSLLSLNNLKVHKTKGVKNVCIQYKKNSYSGIKKENFFPAWVWGSASSPFRPPGLRYYFPKLCLHKVRSTVASGGASFLFAQIIKPSYKGPINLPPPFLNVHSTPSFFKPKEARSCYLIPPSPCLSTFVNVTVFIVYTFLRVMK